MVEQMETTNESINLSLSFQFLGKEKETSIFNSEDINLLDVHNKKEPDWRFMFFDWMPDKIKLYFNENIEKIYSHSNMLFIKGLKYEYGINNNNKINYKKAFSFYLSGAKLNNQYCLFKLFYILIDDNCYEKYNLYKDVDLAMFMLIKSASYNEAFLDINKIDPIIKLMYIIYYRDQELNRCRKLLEKMKYDQNVFNIPITETEFKYLYYFLKLNFCNRDYEFKDALKNLELISSENHLEATYKLACLYYNPIHKDICKKDPEKSLKLFTKLFSLGYSKSYCSFYKVCEEMKVTTYDVEEILKISKKLKNFSAQFYANYLSKNKDEILKNSSKIFKNFFRSFLYGNLISIVICFEIISQIYYKNLSEGDNFDHEYYLTLIFDFVEKRRNDQQLAKILDYDIMILFHQIYAYFYYKGILVKKDIKKSIEILESTFKDKKSFKNYRKVFYYLGKAYKKIGNVEKSEYFLKSTFDIYILLKEFPYHHYIVAKLFLKGTKHIQKNIEYAYYFFSLGANYKENYFFINSFFSKKCENYLKNQYELKQIYHQGELKMDLDRFIDHNKVCIVCVTNFRQVIFSKCAHKILCFICYEKMLAKNENTCLKCPMCNQENTYCINTFELEPYLNKINRY
jgi:TPR repeat protein